MNPMQMLQGMRNPQQFLQQIVGNNSVMSNPMIKNAMSMAQSGNSKGIEQMARNLCKEKGINPDDVMKQIRGNFGI